MVVADFGILHVWVGAVDGLLGAFKDNLGLGFVNGLGYHAIVLAAGNGLSLAGCVIAVGLVRRYRRRNRATTATATPVHGVVAELHTQEFVVLGEAVLAEHTRRTGEIVLAA